MKFRKVINKPIRGDEDGVSVAGGVNAVVNANVNEPGSESHVSSKQKVRVVQRGGRTETFEVESETDDSTDE
ncbi:MAG: hypothetical protein QOK47_918 [Actinomycetota bacterium]|nr:hypothetical protein [Actinomycetota bacterium]